VTATDRQTGAGGALTATHDIDIQVSDLSDGSRTEDVKISAPAGVHVKDNQTVISDTPGPVPITVSWTEFAPNECTGSVSLTLQLAAPTPLSFGKLPRSLRPKKLKFHGKYYGGGWTLTALLRPTTDRRPLEMRFKGIARAKLPSASMPFKTVMASLRDLEPGIDRRRVLRGPKWEIDSRTNFPHTALFLEARIKTGSSHDHPVGYEFVALQGGRQIIRVRAAGTCNFGGCKWRKFSVDYLGI